MKKFVIASVIVAGSTYLTGRVVLKTVPIVLHEDKASKLNLPVSPSYWIKLCNFVAMKMPYGQFCEITGCTYELHANYEHLISQAMSEHLSKAH